MRVVEQHLHLTVFLGHGVDEGHYALGRLLVERVQVEETDGLDGLAALVALGLSLETAQVEGDVGLLSF